MARLRTAVVLAVAALVALAASGCTSLEPGSLAASQTGPGGSVHVHFEACSLGEAEGGGPGLCGPIPQKTKEEFEKEFANTEEQLLLAFAVPVGSTPPPTITAVGVGAAPNITYIRNAEVSATFAGVEREEGDTRPWPPPGTEIVGYASAYRPFKLEEWKWTVDADFGLPVPVDGSAYAGPFTVEEADGLRYGGELGEEVPVKPEDRIVPTNRPINCQEEEPDATLCEIHEGVSTPVTDLRLAPPTAPTIAFPGGHASVAFPAAYASSAVPPAPFAVAATTGLSGASATPAAPTLAPAVDSASHRAGPLSAAVNVSLPKGAKPGPYPVTITAAGPAGRTVIQSATLTVVSAKPKPGKVRQLRKKGTAQVAVGVPGAGTLVVSGKGVVEVKKKASAGKTLKVIVKAKGSAAAKLAATGRASVKPKFKFKPASGAAATAPFKLILVRE